MGSLSLVSEGFEGQATSLLGIARQTLRMKLCDLGLQVTCSLEAEEDSQSENRRSGPRWTAFTYWARRPDGKVRARRYGLLPHQETLSPSRPAPRRLETRCECPVGAFPEASSPAVKTSRSFPSGPRTIYPQAPDTPFALPWHGGCFAVLPLSTVTASYPSPGKSGLPSVELLSSEGSLVPRRSRGNLTIPWPCVFAGLSSNHLQSWP
jgi:hypothetical protein